MIWDLKGNEMVDCALLTENRKVTAISWGREGEGYRYISQPTVDRLEIESVAGNGAYVPWVAVWHTDGSVTRFNASELLSVTFAAPSPPAENPDELDP